jgi:hypothetical protein
MPRYKVRPGDRTMRNLHKHAVTAFLELSGLCLCSLQLISVAMMLFVCDKHTCATIVQVISGWASLVAINAEHMGQSQVVFHPQNVQVVVKMRTVGALSHLGHSCSLFSYAPLAPTLGELQPGTDNTTAGPLQTENMPSSLCVMMNRSSPVRTHGAYVVIC